MPSESKRFPPFPMQMLGWYVVLAAGLLVIVLHFAPHFSYSLDDPYIHLALAQNILHGHYGINPGETVSPSSSVVWPLLLAPLSESVVREWVPLAWNVVFAGMTCLVLGRFLGERLAKNGMRRLESAWFAPVVLVAGNLIGLTFTGMEHCLQILLVSCCAIAVVRAYEGESIPGYCLAAAALAPGVRYENLAFTAAVCGVLWLRRRQGSAVALFLVSLLPILILGMFLHAHGLSFFPNSVLAKSKVAEAGTGSHASQTAIAHLLGTMRENALLYLKVGNYSRKPITLLFVWVAFAAWTNRRARPGVMVAPALLAALAMVLVGPYGWFYRYDVGVRFFLFVIALCLAMRVFPARRWLVWSVGVIAAVSYVPALIGTGFSCVQIARQQYEMHRFTSEFSHENVAVNDLGWVSLDANGRYYVLDLAGLASNESLRVPEKEKNAAWLDGITRKHDVGLVMMYRTWYPESPANWVALGVLRQRKLWFKRELGEDEVFFYATTPASAARLAPELREFSATLPKDVAFVPAHP